jgi:hypothetical protein
VSPFRQLYPIKKYFWKKKQILIAGAITILKNDGVRQWGWDAIPYMKWKIIQSCSSHHQPAIPKGNHPPAPRSAKNHSVKT